MMKKVLKSILAASPCLVIIAGIVFSVSRPLAAEQPEITEEYDLVGLRELLEANAETEKAREAETETETQSEEAVVSDAEYKDGTHYGTGTGFAGTIKVCVVVENKKIKTIDVVEVEKDDASFVERAKGVIDQIIKTQSMSVDAVSGATYSSRGIIEAVKNALTGESSSSAPASSTSANQSAPPSTTNYKAPESGYINGTYYGTAKGFGGTIKVKVVIKKKKIKSIDVVEAPGEGASYLDSAKTMIPKMVKAQSPNVDAVSGATYTSNGIINAVADALEQAKSSSSKKNKKETDKETEKETNAATEAQTEAVEYETPAAYKDGTYSAQSRGFRGNMTVTVVITGGKITDIQVSAQDDEPYITNAKQLISRIIAAQDVTGIDVVSGATFSSNGILNGVKLALKQAAVSPETGETEKQTEKETEKQTEAKPSETESEGESPYNDGTYVGIGAGFIYDIQAAVTITGGRIINIAVSCPDDSGDEEWIWVQNDIVPVIIQKQNASAVDAVSGATYSSNGLIKAVQQALAQARKEGM